MKKRKFTLVNTLANEIEKASYQKVSVTTICDEVGCSRQNFYYYFDSIDEAIKELVDVDIKDISDFQIKANALRTILTIIQKRKVFYSKMFDTAESENLICKLFLEKLVDLYDNLASYFVRGYSNECKAFTRPILIQFAMADIALISDWDFTEEETCRCAELLKNFIAVSVREASAVELCRKYFGRNDVKVVLDPTMLLDASDYPSINGAATDRPYVFTYILDWDYCKGRIVESLTKELGLPEYSSEYNSFGKKLEKRLSIEGWLTGISNANLVICDSFHGTAFSILNHRPFIVLCNSERGNTRMQWLLELFGLQDRMVQDVSEVDSLAPIDWDSIDTILNRERIKSINFLNTALKSV